MKIFNIIFPCLTIFMYACSEQEAIAPSELTSKSSEQIQKPGRSVSAGIKERGQQVYSTWCAHCHDPGNSHPGTLGLAARLGEDKAVLLERDDLNEVYIKTIVRQGLMMMPPFRPTEITSDDLDALAIYILNSANPDENSS